MAGSRRIRSSTRRGKASRAERTATAPSSASSAGSASRQRAPVNACGQPRPSRSLRKRGDEHVNRPEPASMGRSHCLGGGAKAAGAGSKSGSVKLGAAVASGRTGSGNSGQDRREQGQKRAKRRCRAARPDAGSRRRSRPACRARRGRPGAQIAGARIRSSNDRRGAGAGRGDPSRLFSRAALAARAAARAAHAPRPGQRLRLEQSGDRGC